MHRKMSKNAIIYCDLRDTLIVLKTHQADKYMPSPHYPSAAVRKALSKLGGDLRDARRRRRLPMSVVAERAFTSRSTLQRVEEGDTSVSMGIYAAVLNALGLLEGLGQAADPAMDSVGQALANESLPQRVRLKASQRPL